MSSDYRKTLEIERKFLVDGDFMPFVKESVHIAQGYLNTTPGRIVRVRIKGDKGFLTIKGPCSESGASRYEWEKEITGDRRYYNSMLMKHPYRTWKEQV